MTIRQFSIRLRPLAVTAAAVAILAGCGFQADQRGNAPDKLSMGKIQPGVTDKATVTNLLGSPSTVAQFDNNTWYYVSQRTKEIAFFKPELLDEKVVSITFDDKGLVKKIAYLNMRDHREVEPNPNATPAPGREFTLLEQLIGNFGRFAGTAPTDSGSTAEQGPGH
jgi:outer membrane protein assembly factor BamE (lipoprotein component of BamABCDE complex)